MKLATKQVNDRLLQDTKFIRPKLRINPVIQNLKIKTLKIKKLKTVVGENRSALLGALLNLV